jgi:L-asparaginase II
VHQGTPRERASATHNKEWKIVSFLAAGLSTARCRSLGKQEQNRFGGSFRKSGRALACACQHAKGLGIALRKGHALSRAAENLLAHGFQRLEAKDLSFIELPSAGQGIEK